MKTIGIIRRIDDLGRIVVPKELRASFSLAEGDPVEIYAEGNTIILKKYEESCIFCGEKTDNVFKEKKVCQNCLKELKG